MIQISYFVFNYILLNFFKLCTCRSKPNALLLSTIDCEIPERKKWPEDLAWHPNGEMLFCAYGADGGGPQVSTVDLKATGKVSAGCSVWSPFYVMWNCLCVSYIHMYNCSFMKYMPMVVTQGFYANRNFQVIVSSFWFHTYFCNYNFLLEHQVLWYPILKGFSWLGFSKFELVSEGKF